MDRRISTRARLAAPLWMNKHLDGFPHLVELRELSESGMLIRTTLEPKTPDKTFSLELGIPGSAHKLWLWAEIVRQSGKFQALRITYADLLERAQLRQLVRWNACSVA